MASEMGNRAVQRRVNLERREAEQLERWQRRRAGAALLLFVVAGVLVALFASGCVPKDTVADIVELRDGCRELERAADASEQERDTGQRVGDALDQLLFDLDEQELPSDVRERRAKRKADAEARAGKGQCSGELTWEQMRELWKPRRPECGR